MGKYRRPLTRGGRERFLEEDLINALKKEYTDDAAGLYNGIDYALDSKKDKLKKKYLNAKEIDDVVRGVICYRRVDNVMEKHRRGSSEIHLPGDYFEHVEWRYAPDCSCIEPGREFGVDVKKVLECGPDPITIMTFAVNGMFDDIEFRMDEERTEPFCKRVKQKALELEIFELGVIKGVIDRLVRDEKLDEVPGYITNMIRETSDLVISMGGGRQSSAQSGFSKQSGKNAAAQDPGMHAFVFICRGPDPSGLTDILQGMGMTSDGIPEAMREMGYTGTDKNIHMYAPGWNDTVYSSPQLKMKGEADDLMNKIKAKLKSEGFTYKGEAVKTVKYSPETRYAKMGFFMTYLFIRK